MKYRFLSISFIYFFLVAQISYAMDVEEGSSGLCKQLVVMKNGMSDVKFLSKNTLVITGEGCSLFDLETKIEKRIKEPDRFNPDVDDYFDLAVRSDGKKFAFSYGKTVELYDAQTHKLEWKKEEEYPISSFEFSSDNSTIVMCLNKQNYRGHRIVKRDYSLKNMIYNDYIASQEMYPQIALHPEKQMLCVANMWNDVLLYPSLDFESDPIVIVLSHTNDNCLIGAHDFVAVRDDEGKIISIINPHDNNSVWECKRDKKDEWFRAMAFYPRGSVLAILAIKDVPEDAETSDHENIIYYWDILAKKLLHTTSFISHYNDYHLISFDEHGEQGLIVLNDDIERFFVPWKVRYETDIEKNILYPLFFLNQYICKRVVECSKRLEIVPNELIPLLKHTLLRIFER